MSHCDARVPGKVKNPMARLLHAWLMAGGRPLLDAKAGPNINIVVVRQVMSVIIMSDNV